MRLKNIPDSDNQLIHDIIPGKENFLDKFVYPVAESLYVDSTHSKTLQKDFKDLAKVHKSFWYDYAAEIPEKFSSLNFLIRPFEDYCRTCLIPDDEIEIIAQADYDRYSRAQSNSLPGTLKELKKFFRDTCYLIPVSLKKNGFEIIRTEEDFEISILLVRKLARAIHSKYLREIRIQNSIANNYIFYDPGKKDLMYVSEFDDLPVEIKYSNIDNAAHIPTKLLSVGYKIRQVKKGFKPYVLHLKEDEIETMAKVEHLRWSWERRLGGWTYGTSKDDVLKTHPCLVPFEQLSESEKEKDRELVKLIPGFLMDLNYEVYPISPNRIRKLSYAIKPLSSINRILHETRKLNDQIRNLAALTPAIEEMIAIRNRKIEEAILEVGESYNYAKHIQETFLPDDLFIRECFPDSFVVFKPKDVISGDFFFFSKRDDLVIFAAADCTGHGIPGALISTIGYGIIDQAVNELGLTDPSEILHHLYSRVHRFFRKDEEGNDLSDDMDIVLCTLNITTNILLFSGIKNPLYLVTDGELKVYRAQNFIDSLTDGREFPEVSERIQVKTDDTIYLCSDGYIDQFGGSNHKKYGSTQFKSALLKIQDYSLPEQSDRLYEEIESWREKNDEDQTDDILIIGIRI